MKLRVSFCGEGLRVSDSPKGIYVIATEVHPEVGVKPSVLGQTESIVSTTNDVDWTKSFVLDYEFGQEINLIVTLRTGSRSISSALFDVGQVLGNGGILGKELKDNNGILIVRIEDCKCVGQLQLQIRGLQLKNLDGIGFGMNKSDPFFEIQRQCTMVTTNTIAWDAIYRSMVIDNDLNPLFPEFFVDLDELIGSCSEIALAAKKFRLIMYDYDKQGNQEIGSCLLSVNDLIDNVCDSSLSADASMLDPNKCFRLVHGRSQEVTGTIVVVKAALIGASAIEESSEQTPLVESSTIQDAVQIPPVYESDEREVKPSDVLGSTFCNYIKCGCQLQVICAIDATASNGDPRQESSLHHFNDNSLNAYEESLQAICSVFGLYDSDQKYPLYGFGARRDGVVNHCFPFSPTLEVNGVSDILKVYRETFRSGMVMSTPRDFSEVIHTAGKAGQRKKSGLSYSILLIFTNGCPADSDAMVHAIQDVNDIPISIVFIGIGKGDDLSSLAEIITTRQKSGLRDNVRYVPYGAGENQHHLAKLALQDIPNQLEEYFLRKNIHPDPTHLKDEIDVLPYSPITDVEVPMEINAATGEIKVTGDVNPVTQDFSAKLTLTELKRLGQKINANPTFGRIKRNINKNAVRQARYKINRLVGQSIL